MHFAALKTSLQVLEPENLSIPELFSTRTRCSPHMGSEPLRGGLPWPALLIQLANAALKALRPDVDRAPCPPTSAMQATLVQASRHLFQSPQAWAMMEGACGKWAAAQRCGFNCFPLPVCMFTYCERTWIDIQRSQPPTTTHQPPPTNHQLQMVDAQSMTG